MTSTTAPTPKTGTARRRAALAVLPAAVLMLVAACSTGDPSADPTTTSPVPPSVSWPPSSPSATTKDTAALRAAAYKNAKTNYTRWMQMQLSKRANLPQEARQVATRKVIDKANETNRAIFQKGITSPGHTKVVSMKGISYAMPPAGKVVMDACVVSTQRFMKDGKDVTVDPQGNPLPKGETRSRVRVTFATPDKGTTWRVAALHRQEKPC